MSPSSPPGVRPHTKCSSSSRTYAGALNGYGSVAASTSSWLAADVSVSIAGELWVVQRGINAYGTDVVPAMSSS